MPRIQSPTPAVIPMTSETSVWPLTYARRARSMRVSRSSSSSPPRNTRLRNRERRGASSSMYTEMTITSTRLKRLSKSVMTSDPRHLDRAPGVALEMGDVDRVQKPLAGRLHVDLDRARVVDPALEVGEPPVGGRHPGAVLGELVLDLVCDVLDLARDHRRRRSRSGRRRRTRRTGRRAAPRCPGDAKGAERPHDRVQKDGDQRSDHEHEDGVVDRGDQQPHAHDRKRKAYKLNPPRDQDLPGRVGRHRGHPTSGPMLGWPS